MNEVFRRRRLRLFPITTALAACLVATQLFVPPAAAAGPEDVAAQQDPSPAVGKFAAKVPPFPSMPKMTTSPVTWPAPGEAVVAAPAAGKASAALAGGLPVKVSRNTSTGLAVASENTSVKVEVLPGDVAKAAGMPLLLKVSSTNGQPLAGLSLEVGYGSFKDAHGADWGNRLTMVRLPACAVTTPAAGYCLAQEQLAVVNNTRAHVLTADLNSAAVPQLGELPDRNAMRAAGTGEPLVFGVLAGGASDIGDYTKTDFHPDFTWQAGDSAAEYSMNYPITVPPVSGALVPTVALSYSSGNVDGQTVGVNVQPFWGEGWNYTPGYIERAYRKCNDDKDNAYHVITTSDNCWRMPNARMVLGGKSVELIFGDDGVWRSSDDDAAKVELLTGGGTGHWNGEHWKVSAADGTVYYFGLTRLPGWEAGDRVTDGSLAMPVFSNHTGDPCLNTGSWTASWCLMSYRWNLDYVVDRNGNTMSYWYTKEFNSTAMAGNPNQVGGYDRFAVLSSIEYGTRAGTGATRESRPNATPPARVVFNNVDRCLSGVCPVHDRANYPDTAWDLNCSAAPCSANMSPSFWSAKRVSQIATEVYSGTGTAYNRVDEWALGADFPADASGNPLWLTSITRTGKSGGATKTLPPTQFFGTRYRNRADWDPNGTMADPQKYRITSIRNDSGGQVDITYNPTDPGCQFGSPFPDPDTNASRCFPRYWTNPTGSSGWAWWHKYTVNKVVEKDLVGGAPDVETVYNYTTDGSSSPVLWAHDQGALVFSSSNSYKSWADWRGYSTVTTTVGTIAGQQSQKKVLYYRGLHGDNTDSGAYTRSATVTNSLGEVSNDEKQFAGMPHETQVLNGPAGQVLSKKVNNYNRYLTGTRNISSSLANPPTSWSYIARGVRERDVTWLPGTSTWRTNEKASQWHPTYGVIENTDALGDPNPAVTADDVCTRYSYTFPAAGAPYLINFPKQVESVGVKCATAPTYPQDKLSDVRTFYDNAAYGIAPVKGNGTRTEAVEKYVGSTATIVLRGTTAYDAWGRVTSIKDGRGKETTTVYTQGTSGLATTIKVKNALLHEVTTTLDAWRSNPLAITDPNGKVTNFAYDPLGRRTKVWLPGHLTSGTPDVEYQYELQQTAPSYVKTRKLGPNGNQIDSFEFYDGLLRPRQTQETTPAGQRRVVDTAYDTRGFVVKQSKYNDAAAAPGPPPLAALADTSIDEQARYTYDGAGRKTGAEQWYRNTFKWKNTYIYGGDRIATLKPTGGTHEQDIFDVRGNILKKRQFLTTDINGAYEETSYTYDRKGQLTSVSDAAARQWTFGYDLLGRQIQATSPDTGAPGASFGTSTFTYDLADRKSTATDPRGNTLAYAYDDVNRMTGVFEGSLSGTQRSSWTFDTVAKGQLTSSSRIDTTGTYTSAVTSYDNGYRPLSTTHTIPGFGAGGTTLTYTVGATYKTNGDLATMTVPTIAGISAETLTYSYSTQGMPTTITSGLGTYISSTSYAFDGLTTQQLLGASGSRFKLNSSYDASTRRLTNLSVSTETATVGTYQTKYSTDYGYDASGNITSAAGKTFNGTTLAADQEECFRYDHLGRMKEAWTQVSGACTTPQRTGADPYWRQWTFENGSRKTQKDIDSGAGNTDWTYNMGGTACGGAAKPHQVTSVTATGPKAGTPTRSFCYDNGGNLTTRTTETGAAQTLTWDKEGHLRTLVQGGTTHTYIYDADGNRLIAKDSSTGDTLYLPDGTEIKKLTTGQLDATRYYSRGGGKPFAMRQGTTVTWLASDQHGTSLVQATASGLNLTRRRMMPFGETRGAQPAWVGTKGFVNGTADVTGLVHLGAREYDPTLGRFTSLDPLLTHDQPQQLHPYNYANHSPVSLSDPSGLKYDPDEFNEPAAVPIVIGIIAGAAELAATVAAAAAAVASVAYAIWNFFAWAFGDDNTAEEAAAAAGIHGTEEGAEALQGIADELNEDRWYVNGKGEISTVPADRGVVSVIKVWDAETGEYIIKVAAQTDRIKVMPDGWEEIIRSVVGSEIAIEFVRNPGKDSNGKSIHAEVAIVASLGGRQVIVEGGTSKNVCHNCAITLGAPSNVILGGVEYLRHFKDKTDFRAFWRPRSDNSYPVGTGDWGMTP